MKPFCFFNIIAGLGRGDSSACRLPISNHGFGVVLWDTHALVVHQTARARQRITASLLTASSARLVHRHSFPTKYLRRILRNPSRFRKKSQNKYLRRSRGIRGQSDRTLPLSSPTRLKGVRVHRRIVISRHRKHSFIKYVAIDAATRQYSMDNSPFLYGGSIMNCLRKLITG